MPRSETGESARAFSLQSSREWPYLAMASTDRIIAGKGECRSTQKTKLCASSTSRRQPLREPLLDCIDPVRFPFVVLAHRDLEVLAVGRELDRQLVRDELERAGIDRP